MIYYNLLCDVDLKNRHTVVLEGCPVDVAIAVTNDMLPYIGSNREFNDAVNIYYINCQKGVDDNISVFEKQMTVTWNSAEWLHKTLRKIIRAYYYKALTKQGWIHIHAGAILNERGEAILFTGDKGSGKTSSVLGCIFDSEHNKYIGNDRILINRNNQYIIGYPAALGIGEKTHDILNIKADIGYKYSEKTWIVPSELRCIGINATSGGKLKRIIVPIFDFSVTDITVFKLDPIQVLNSNILPDITVSLPFWKTTTEERYVLDNWISNTDWCSEIECIGIRCNGLTDKYINVLREHIR